MIGLNISQTKKMFFDRQTVLSAESKATTRVLSKFGSFVRRTARGLLRRKSTKSNPVSKPGEPPRQHTGRLREFLYFAYEPSRRSVVIGPAKLGGVKYGDQPRTLEEGGSATRRVRGESVRVYYEPRPFMGPAYAKEAPKLPGMWKNSVRK